MKHQPTTIEMLDSNIDLVQPLSDLSDQIKNDVHYKDFTITISEAYICDSFG